MTSPAIAFGGSSIDRADHVRGNPDAIAALMGPGARLLKLDGLDPVMGPEGGLVWGSLAEADPAAELLFLGLQDGEGRFAQVLPGIPAAGAPGWNAMNALEPGELAAYGGARSLVSWHARHRFCAVCGAPTTVAKGGWQRTCTGCETDHFPRVDPVTIMTVEHDGRLLLGRQPRFPAGRYSALAGFVEPGETVEEAVAREVFEEAGVRVRDVEYVASQPWPFPSSLMIGCHAYADSPEIVIDETELEDVRWFTRAQCIDALDAVAVGEQGRAFGAPPKHAVAHVLLRWWVDRETS
ncbi:NAD(+) diphosphatase [Novosphingobium gossypii]|uniref:NAD(+) diphosphatase n=1 Tax=Novosphingobium gossypii TaxID=1604774 RepID=UPI003D1B17A7